MDKEQKLELELNQLYEEHKKLDKTIQDMICCHECDHVEIQSLKKRKLILKDRIVEIEETLYPDIIA
jgi:hypothetical protein